MLKRFAKLSAVFIAAALAFAPVLAEAAAGGRNSMGSRGSRTTQSAPPTQTAPGSQGVQRTQTPAQQAAPGMARQAQPSFFQRHPFLTGLMGGLLGAGLIGMLMGGGLLPNFDFAGILGLLLQVGLIVGVIALVMAFIRRRQASQQPQQPGYAFAGGPTPQPGAQNQPDGAMARTATAQPFGIGQKLGGGAMGAGRDEIGVQGADYEAFERLLGQIQTAWSNADANALRGLLTPEMFGYFSEELAALASKGVRDVVEDVKFEKGDLAEAWDEGDAQYATVAMRWSALDYRVRNDTGQVVEGNKNVRSDTTEIWTFMRARGGQWLLSAIQQVE
jgi:predicted lipid-binding transport protein (Tim44 family)